MAAAVRASVRDLGEDRWELRVTTPDPEARSRRRTRTKTVRATSESDAERALRHFVVDLGLDPDAPATLAGALESWFRHSAKNRSAGSNKAARITLDRHVLPGLGHLPLTKVNVVDLEMFYDRKADDGYAPSTIRHMHFTVQPTLRLAVRWGWLDRNPAEYVELPPLGDSKITAPSAEVVVSLLDAAKGELAIFARLLALTGMRDSEASALRWGDVDTDAHAITVTGKIEVVDGKPVRLRTKTKRSNRRLAIDSETAEILADHRPPGARDDHYVFADDRVEDLGTVPWRPDAWSVRWVRLRKKVGVEVRLHDLRHFHATSLFEDGARVERVSARLGHSRTSTTHDVYGHILDPEDRDLADGIASRLRRG